MKKIYKEGVLFVESVYTPLYLIPNIARVIVYLHKGTTLFLSFLANVILLDDT